jgi:hypothetical protein
MTRARLAIACLLVASCGSDTDVAARPEAREAGPSIDNGWDPTSGRGVVRVRTGAGETAEIQLQNGFEGYTGGLVLGGHGSSGYRVWPRGAAPSEKPLAIWCAQDESILLASSGREYGYGWSENFGRGADGVPLRYLGGRVLEDAPDRLVLASANGALPFRVDRWMSLDAGGTPLFRVRITNSGEDPIAFDFWTGDDPWVGEYGASKGDLGWTSRGIVTHEGAADLLPGECLGIADTVIAPGGAPEARLANAFCLSPSSPRPDAVYFANGFAHSEADIDADRPLLGDSPTGFNVGWRDVALAPGERFETGYALGRAMVERSPGGIRPPRIDPSEWRRLEQLAPIAVNGMDRLGDPLRFTGERVEVRLLPGGEEVEVRGSYVFENRGTERLRRRIYFPFAVDEDHPYPGSIRVDSGRPTRMRDGIVFGVEVDAGAERTVRITYRQRSADRSATYIVTSARSWIEPIERAELVVAYPAGLPVLEVSYPMGEPEERGDEIVRLAIMERFLPDRELTIRW